MTKKTGPMAILEDDLPHAAVLTVPVADHELRAHFHRVRILGGAFVVAAAIATIMILLAGDGMKIETFSQGSKSDDEIKKLVDTYNSISGSIGSAVSKPVEMFLGLFVSAAFLCLATEFTLGKASVGHWQYVPMLAAAAIAYLFGNGLNALNVQVVTGKLRPRIILDDLMVLTDFGGTVLSADGFIEAPWRSDSLESAATNSISNTILLSKITTLTYLNSPCNGTGVKDVTAPLLSMPVVSFGFPSRTWQYDTFLTALSPAKSLKITMNTSTSDLPSDSALPSSIDVLRGLVNMGSYVLDDLRLASNYDVDYQTLSNESPNFIQPSHALWTAMINRTANATLKDSSVEYTHFALSDKITYDAMTLEIPIPVVQRGRLGDAANTVDGYNQIYVGDYCSREGCIIPPPTVSRNNRSTTVHTRVQVTSICLNEDGTEDSSKYLPPCAKPSLSSMRVVSVGMRTVGDVWDMVQQDGQPVARFTNLRTVYSITVGRLAWKTEDLAKALEADCDVPESMGGCAGLRFKAKSYMSDYKSPVLVTGTTSLPIKALNDYAMTGSDKWVYLVTVGDGLGEQRFDVLRPRNFANVTDSGASLKKIPADKCNTYADEYMRGVEVNHLYMGQSLQPSYTAAFFYLFQNATEVKRDTRTTSVTEVSGNGGATTSSQKMNDNVLYPQFYGNQQDMDVQVSVPLSNAIVSLIGCVLLVLTAVGIVVSASKSERELETRANAELVAEAMMNSSKYPPWLLEMALQQAAAAIHAGHAQPQMAPTPIQLDQESGVDQREQLDENGCVSLQDLRVQSVVFQHQDDAGHVLHIGPEQFKP